MTYPTKWEITLSPVDYDAKAFSIGILRNGSGVSISGADNPPFLVKETKGNLLWGSGDTSMKDAVIKGIYKARKWINAAHAEESRKRDDRQIQIDTIDEIHREGWLGVYKPK